MAKPKCRWESPETISDWFEWLAAGLHARNRWRLGVLLLGILFAQGRRTVTTWLRAAGVSDDFQDYYYFLAAVGRKTDSVAKTVPAIPGKRGWRFATKLQLAARLVEWIAPIVKKAGKTLWVVVDGGYTKRPFLKRAIKAGVTVVGRLRVDAGLRDLPPPLKKGQRRGRGRPRKYGKNRISLAKRAGQRRGWQTIECTLYNEPVIKTCKTFLATYAPVGGVIRVVLVKEDHGWLPLLCTDPDATVAQILEAFSDRATIEQDFHDVKEVWGAGQQQVRNIWTNVAAYHMNLWMHTLVELWAWDRNHADLSDRSDSPWDDVERRPSHANRRKALRQTIMRNELFTITAVWRLPRKIIRLAESLMALAG